ncbi:MAG TPA: hypothetical protein VFN61_05840, partial [Acidimicrobiales bacterium]|nr:hypothetical protein [Acidimicrobiales bacterium]
MRRRISLIMVAMVVGALAFSGVITLGLTVLNSVDQTRSALLTEASGVAQGIDQEIQAGTHDHASFGVLQHVLAVLKAPLGLQNESVLAVREDGTFYNPLSPKLTEAEILPPGVRRDDIYSSAFMGITTGTPEPVSGHVGRLVWAAQLLPRPIPVACPDKGGASGQTTASNRDTASNNNAGSNQKAGGKQGHVN